MATKVIHIKDIFFDVVIKEFYYPEAMREKSKRVRIKVKDYDDRGRIRANVSYSRVKDLKRFTDFMERLESLYKRAHLLPGMIEEIKDLNRTISLSVLPRLTIDQMSVKCKKLKYDVHLLRLII